MHQVQTSKFFDVIKFFGNFFKSIKTSSYLTTSETWYIYNLYIEWNCKRKCNFFQNLKISVLLYFKRIFKNISHNTWIDTSVPACFAFYYKWLHHSVLSLYWKLNGYVISRVRYPKENNIKAMLFCFGKCPNIPNYKHNCD